MTYGYELHDVVRCKAGGQIGLRRESETVKELAVSSTALVACKSLMYAWFRARGFPSVHTRSSAMVSSPLPGVRMARLKVLNAACSPLIFFACTPQRHVTLPFLHQDDTARCTENWHSTRLMQSSGLHSRTGFGGGWKAGSQGSLSWQLDIYPLSHP